MTDDIRWESLDRYFSGECSPEEQRELQRWIDESDDRRRQVGAMREVWARAAVVSERDWNHATAWRRLAPTLEVPVGEGRRLAVIPGASSIGESRRNRWAYALRAAAAIALLAGGAGLWRVTRTSSPAAPVVALREYITPRGQRATLALTDGTRIVLGPGSRLRAPRDFAATSRRDVYLEGEAFFEVTHDARRPFVVHAAHGVAEDLGTRFVVTAYPGDTAMRVVVAEGVVALRAAADSLTIPPDSSRERVLRAGDLGTVNGAGRLAARHGIATDEYLAWTTGQLIFRDASVRDVVATLSRWYDIDITLAIATAGDRRVTLTTEPSQPLAEVLTALTVPLGLRARWSERAVTIAP